MEDSTFVSRRERSFFLFSKKQTILYTTCISVMNSFLGNVMLVFYGGNGFMESSYLASFCVRHDCYAMRGRVRGLDRTATAGKGRHLLTPL